MLGKNIFSFPIVILLHLVDPSVNFHDKANLVAEEIGNKSFQ